MSLGQTSKVPILTYHSIDKSGSVVSTSPQTFVRQMEILKESDFKVISLKTLVKHFHENKPLPPKTIILTFDDGFYNFYTTAFPVLNEYNFNATVFLITDYCGKFNDWTGNLAALERSKLMDWKEIKELSGHNIEFAAHSRTHADLTRIPVQEAKREMTESKFVIENKLGVSATNFAYPYGVYNTQIEELAREHFKSACSTRLGKVKIGDNPFTLKRLDTYYLSNEKIFSSIFSASFDWYMNFRQWMRDLRTKCYSK